MTHQQLETVEKSLAGLSALDKLELVERLVHELRSSVITEHSASASHTTSLTEAEFKQQLLKSGMMISLPTPPDSSPRPEFEPVMIEGETFSETIVRERR